MTTVSDSLVESYEIIKPSQANSYGNAHGGEIVKVMDELAAISAMRVAGENCVTARISEVNFHTPITKGDVVHVTAFVYETGESSLQVQVKVQRERSDEDSENATTADFTMVSVDENGNPIASGNVIVDGPEDERLVSEAQDL